MAGSWALLWGCAPQKTDKAFFVGFVSLPALCLCSGPRAPRGSWSGWHGAEQDQPLHPCALLGITSSPKSNTVALCFSK